MKQFLQRLIAPLVQDDLFLRVVCLVAGILFGGMGCVLLFALATGILAGGLLAGILAGTFGSAMVGFGLLLVSRCVLSRNTRLARYLDDHLPDAGGLDEAFVLLIVVYLPAILLTLFLRLFGVRGQRRAGEPQT